jgi:gluconate 2-dehydrogenase gamma chain
VKPSRRTVLRWLAGLLGGLTLGVGPQGCRGPQAGEDPPDRPRGPAIPGGPPLDETERELLDAVLEVLLPSYPDEPGARDADVMTFVLRQLEPGAWHRWQRARIQEGLARLDALARDAWGEPFLELAPDEQDRALRYVADGGVDDDPAKPGPRFRGQGFVSGLLGLTLEGFFGDPCHGGNKGQVGWRLIGRAPDALPVGRCVPPTDGSGG